MVTSRKLPERGLGERRLQVGRARLLVPVLFLWEEILGGGREYHVRKRYQFWVCGEGVGGSGERGRERWSVSEDADNMFGLSRPHARASTEPPNLTHFDYVFHNERRSNGL